jgi:predicted ester cyclase
MGTEENKEIVRRIEAAWDNQDLEALDALFAAEFDNSQSGVPGMPRGLEGARMAHHASMDSFPDRRVVVEDVIAEGDKVVVRARIMGTNKGGVAFLGAPANDATIDVPFISIYTLRDGKVVSHFGLNDAVALMVQLGVMSPPGG